MNWIKNTASGKKPLCNMKRDSHGVQVLVWPHVQSGDGYSASPTAFYGCRQTPEPLFYLYGAVLEPQPTHWMPLPAAPN